MDARPQHRPRPPRLWWIAAVFLTVQLGIVWSDPNGPFVDEALYTVAGLRVLEGHGFADGYLGWFNGSPFVWPVLAALGYHVAGLAGARAMAAVLSAVTLLAFAKTAETLFGPAAARWAALGLGVNGLFIALAHFAVYDVAALTALAVAMWCVTHVAGAGAGAAAASVDGRAAIAPDGGRGVATWVTAGALAFAVAVIAKYGHGVMIVPLLGLLAAGRDARSAVRASVVFLVVAGVVLSAYFWTFFGAPYPTSSTNYFQQAFGRTRAHIAVLQVIFGLVPLALASAGAAIAWRGGRRLLAVTCLLALAVFPAFHLWTANFVSGQKHVVAGFLFGYLLVGVALARLWAARSRALAIVVLAVVTTWGTLQWYWQDHSWSDTRPLAEYLARHMSPGDRVLAESPWTYTLYLYPRGRIASPHDVIDAHFTPLTDRPDACRIPWLAGSPQSAAVRDAVGRCRHERVLSSTTHHYYFDTTRLRVSTYPAVTGLYRLPRP